MARELKRTWSKNYDPFSKEDLQDELGDVLDCVFALANQYDINLEAEVKEKLVDKDSRREWKSANNG